jgi:hypothetical protein
MIPVKITRLGSEIIAEAMGRRITIKLESDGGRNIKFEAEQSPAKWIQMRGKSVTAISLTPVGSAVLFQALKESYQMH